MISRRPYARHNRGRVAAITPAPSATIQIPLAGTWNGGYWDSTDGPIDAGAGKVATWEPLEGSIDLVQADPDDQGTLTTDYYAGDTTVLFNGVNEFMEANGLATLLSGINTPCTIAIDMHVVAALPDPTAIIGLGNHTVVGGPYNLLRSDLTAPDSRWEMVRDADSGATVVRTGGAAITGVHRLIIGFDGADVTVWDNGVKAIEALAYALGDTATYTRFTLACQILSSVSAFANIAVRRVAVRTGTISDADASALDTAWSDDLLTVIQALGGVLLIDPVTASSFELSGADVTALTERISSTACTILGAPQYGATAFNGGPGFTFDGTDDLIRGTQAAALAALTDNNEFTMICAVDPTTDDLSAYYFSPARDDNNNGVKSLGQSAAGDGRWRAQSINDAGSVTTRETDASGGVTGPVILEYEGGTEDTLRVNRVLTSLNGTAHNPGTLTPTRWGLGGVARQSPIYSPFTCGIFILFPSHLSDTDKDMLYNAMAAHDESLALDGATLKSGVTDHQFQVGGDAGYTAALDPTSRKFWRFGGASTDKDLIQWVNIDTWVSGLSPTTIGAATGFAVWHSGISKFIIYGGRTQAAGAGITTVWTFDPATEVLTELSEELPVGLSVPIAAVHPASGDVYIFGGITSTATPVDTIYVHDVGAGTITDTTAVLPEVNAQMGVIWAEDVELFFLIGGWDGSSPDYIWTYDPATPSVDAADTGEVLSIGLENLHGAYYDGRIYTFGGYRQDNATYYDRIHRIDTNPVAVSVLTETCHRADDDAVAFYDSVTGKIYVGPWLHSSQVADNHGPDKRVVLEFDPTTETLAAEPSLI